MSKKLLSLPPNLVGCFHDITGLPASEYFCTNDPVGSRLGSGGGTAWVLQECRRSEGLDSMPMEEWLSRERRIIIHAGGQGRRMPAYAPSGKVLTPVPVFRWERGQKLSQTLLDLQLPLYERIIERAPKGLNTMVVSGDVYIRGGARLPKVPEADVVCYGLWLPASTAKNHGVFYSTRENPSALCRMLQKPSPEKLAELLQTGYFLTDIGVWLLSDRAVEMLRARSTGADGNLKEYDLYSDFGRALGASPDIRDEELRSLSVALVPLDGGEFYHFGTGREMISSTLAVQNIVNDQRQIIHRDRKPHPSLFVQNARVEFLFTSENANVWVENSHVAKGWKLTRDNIVTGVPENDWALELAPGQCVDMVPIGDDRWALRVYGIDDKFAGEEQTRPRFPVSGSLDELGRFAGLMLRGAELPAGVELISAERISDIARLDRLVAQRRGFRRENWKGLAANHRHSVFYQTDLLDAAGEFAAGEGMMPEPLDDATEPLVKRATDAMFRAEVLRSRGENPAEMESRAFGLLREGLTATALERKQMPTRAVCDDQIVWSRSPVRIDIAGGWTDTPPYCLVEGGSVINLAIDLNGQQPLQAYVRPCRELRIVCRSIDLGAEEHIDTYEQILDFHRVGSPFSIPKAALALAGFHPRFCSAQYASLRDQLAEFGSGLEITLFSAIPAGSGLGTSSILAATVLGALSDFCSLAWDKAEICRRTLVLEQLLTTGGGWQDQFGGVTGGVKLLESTPGFEQEPQIHWLPDAVFTDPEYAPCHLLYYTGITRTAKNLLAQIVRHMFLNSGEQLKLLRRMKEHTMEMYDALQRCRFQAVGELVRETWRQNCLIDAGTNPPAVARLTSLVDDLCLGYKLPGAGGGGYLYMIAKDPEAASRIKTLLTANPLRPNARMVDMALSRTGLTVTRS